MCLGQRGVPVAGNRLVKFIVLFGCHLIGGSGPDGLLGVYLFVFINFLFNLLLRLFGDFFNLHRVVRVFIFNFRRVSFSIFNFLIYSFCRVDLNGMGNELVVFFDQASNLRFLEEFVLIILEVQDHLSTVFLVEFTRLIDGKRSISVRFPHVLFSILHSENLEIISHKISRVESNTELSNEGCLVLGLRKLLHECLST